MFIVDISSFNKLGILSCGNTSRGGHIPNLPDRPTQIKTRPAVATKSENEALATSAEAEIVIETPLRESDPLLQ